MAKKDPTDLTVEEKLKTLYVKIENAALRADLTMSRATLVHRLNEQVGAQVIADIRFY